MVLKQILVLVTLCIPLPSNQHFIWPLKMCLMADICNHTWIPECGRETNDKDYRIFLDECDFYEYNCDYGKDYVLVNYSECFKSDGGKCPIVPCPSHPPCKNHRDHRPGDRYITPETTKNARRMLLLESTPLLTPHPLPAHMLRGKRRYTPIPLYLRTKAKIKATKIKAATIKAAKIQAATTTIEKKCSKAQTQPLRKTTLSKPKQGKSNRKNFKILKKEVMMKNGRKLIRVVWGKPKTTKAMKDQSDFLEG